VFSGFAEFLDRADFGLGLVDFFVAARFWAVDCRVVWTDSVERGDLGLVVLFFPDAFCGAID